MLALVMTLGAVVGAATSSSAATTVPEAPTALSATAGVDGVLLSWSRGSTQTGGVPTSYVVHRRATGHDLDVSVATAITSASWNYPDRAVPPGTEATYTVSAHNDAGDSAESAPVTVTVPSWDGPYTPDRVSLTLVWDHAVGGDEAPLSTVAATADTTPSVTQKWDNGVSFSADGWQHALVLPRHVQDGTYAIGQETGQLPLRAMAGSGSCGSPAGGSAPGGTATVSRSADTFDGFYASISVDATFECENGQHLHAQLRWHTPDAARFLSAPALSTVTAAPGATADRSVTVTNSGSVPMVLGSARFVDASLSTAAPLTVVGSTCEGATLAAGATCAVTVRYAAGAASSREGRGVLTIGTAEGDWDLGLVAGQQPARYSGPQALAGSSSPGRITLTWTAPWTIESRLIAGWRVEDVEGSTPVVLQNRSENYLTTTVLKEPAPGAHRLRLVMLISDGREVASEPIPLTVATRWLLTTTSKGVQAYDADGGITNGGTLGGRSTSTSGIATSPTRKALVVGEGPFSGRVQLVDLGGNLLRGLTYDPTFADTDPDVSPDGATIALMRPGYSGATNRPSSLITVPAAGGPLTTVPSSTGLSNPVWTPDGTALIATADSGAGLVRIVPGTGARTSIPGTAGAAAVAVSRTGRVAYALTGWGGSGQVRLTGLTGGTSTLVGTHVGATDLSWDPTGQWLAVTGAPYGEPSVTQLFDLRGSAPVRVRQLPGGDSVSWSVPISAAPTSSVTAPAWTTSTASLGLGATDPDDAPGGLTRECMLDGGAWTPCAATWQRTGLAAGRHTASTRATDPSGQVSAIAQRSWSVDTQAPTITVAALPSTIIGSSLKLAWTVSDRGGSGVGPVSVRYRSASLNTSYGALTYPATWQAFTGASMTTTLSSGRQYCFSARVRDVAGNTSSWSVERCTSVVLDDRALTASSGWTRGTGSAHAYGTYSRATSIGRTLTRTSVQARRIALVATTCSTCGAVDVYHAGVKVGRVSLYSATTSYRRVLWLPLQSTVRSGSVVVKTTSTKQAIVDGIAVLH
ncbi:hypothetical protein ABEG17_08585 [Pedococcus sp. KACC 23699]|uniref:Fibronectin type-III domain-containing protein n=1 Tax=Pedococcus sp. KACC 23699 TaxID=3149228 RepID=A0AAU7JYJ3_9MICO